jgi:hypothetical protein
MGRVFTGKNRPASAGKVAEARERMIAMLGEDGLEQIERLIGAPCEYEIKCLSCGKQMFVRPPAGDDLRLKAIELLAKYGVGAKKEEEVTERIILQVDV